MVFWPKVHSPGKQWNFDTVFLSIYKYLFIQMCFILLYTFILFDLSCSLIFIHLIFIFFITSVNCSFTALHSNVPKWDGCKFYSFLSFGWIYCFSHKISKITKTRVFLMRIVMFSQLKEKSDKPIISRNIIILLS